VKAFLIVGFNKGALRNTDSHLSVCYGGAVACGCSGPNDDNNNGRLGAMVVVVIVAVLILAVVMTLLNA
jgi:hypothetical protein